MLSVTSVTQSKVKVLNHSSFELLESLKKLYIVILDAVIHNVPHLEQASSWDCGLTCLRMVMPSNLAENFHQNARTICAEEYQHQR